jgi:hypothetical protein
MRKLATLGLTVGLGLAAAGMSLPASAGVYVGVGVPGVVVAPPAVTFPGYYYGPHYYPYGYARFGYGWGYGRTGIASATAATRASAGTMAASMVVAKR